MTLPGQGLATHVWALREGEMCLGKVGHGSGPPRRGHHFLLENSEETASALPLIVDRAPGASFPRLLGSVLAPSSRGWWFCSLWGRGQEPQRLAQPTTLGQNQPSLVKTVLMSLPLPFSPPRQVWGRGTRGSPSPGDAGAPVPGVPHSNSQQRMG